MIILINFYLFLCVAPAWHSSHHTSWLVACLSCGWWSWMDQDIFKNNHLHHHFRSTSKITWCLVWNHSWNSQFLSQLKYDQVRDRKFTPSLHLHIHSFTQRTWKPNPSKMMDTVNNVPEKNICQCTFFT